MLLFALFFYTQYAWGASLLQPVSFPTTSMDAGFVERRDNAAAGYKPFTGRSAYQPIVIESEEKYMLRRAESVRQNDLITMTNAQYCEKYPLDATNCPQTPGAYESAVAIGNRPTATTPVQTSTMGQGSVSFNNQTIITGPHIHDGPCTPPQRSNVFVNKILTSGQYAQSDPAFEKTMITTFRAEGGCGNHPNDSGGYTCYGISQNNNPEIDVRNITRADAENIAHRKYYAQYGIDKLPDYIRGDVFTFGWASGPVTAIRNLCRVLGIPERNTIDSEIVMATENYNGDLHNDYLDAMQKYFEKCAQEPDQHVFLNSWMNRVKLTRENSCHYPTTDPIL